MQLDLVTTITSGQYRVSLGMTGKLGDDQVFTEVIGKLMIESLPLVLTKVPGKLLSIYLLSAGEGFNPLFIHLLIMTIR